MSMLLLPCDVWRMTLGSTPISLPILDDLSVHFQSSRSSTNPQSNNLRMPVLFYSGS